MLESLLRIPALAGGVGAGYLFATADGNGWLIGLGIFAAAVCVASFIGGWAAADAEKDRTLDEAIARKDEWEQQHDEDRARER
ncbi:hypothetical protein JOE58_001771 [Curtobacterium luteum]|uniref:Uncharacterized protein n=1 Tax=Curtobacterium luteum TaxID=33881 RepID=A0A8H9GA44_9MICO|nr:MULTISPECIES: hypothetical protein [Curtobacterium]MBM7802520.1 hypothetical protein [Curtobacterium luteum]GGL07275.1 hypothetical protein GCM10009769_26940 [Curtobacterium luteum]